MYGVLSVCHVISQMRQSRKGREKLIDTNHKRNNGNISIVGTVFVLAVATRFKHD